MRTRAPVNEARAAPVTARDVGDQREPKATPEFKLGLLRIMLAVEIKCLPDARQLFEAYEKVDEALKMSRQAERKVQDVLADIKSKLTN